MTILNPNNQWVIFKDYLSTSLIQVSVDFNKKIPNNQSYELQDYTKCIINFNEKSHSIALFGLSNIVLRIENALALYKL